MKNKFTFENYTANETNQFAFGISKEVCKADTSMFYSPLTIIGPHGCGKTHLLCAIRNELSDKRSQNVLFINGCNIPSKREYSLADVLIIDKLENYCENAEVQENLYHLYNYFYDNKKQIVFALAGELKSIYNFEGRITSRICRGITAEIKP